jgi:serine/threonine-protein kinase ATR
MDTDCLVALFHLCRDSAFAQHAVWITAWAIDCGSEFFGPLELDRISRESLEQLDQQSNVGDFPRKRERNGGSSPRSDSPVKKQRLNSGEASKAIVYRFEVIHNSIVSMLSSALKATHYVLTANETATKTALNKEKGDVASAILLLVTSTTLSRDDSLSGIAETLVSCMERLLNDLFAARRGKQDVSTMEEDRILMACALALQDDATLSLHTSPKIRALIRKLAAFSDEARVLSEEWTGGFEIRKTTAPGRFPLTPLDTDVNRQRSRLRVLYHNLKTEKPFVNDSDNDLTKSTVEVLRLASFRHINPLVRLLLWQVSGWLLYTSSDIERVLSMAGDTGGIEASKMIKFLISTPFSDEDEQVRMYAAKELGPVLTANAAVRKFISNTSLEGRSRETAPFDVYWGLEMIRLFKDIDGLLHHCCSIPQSQLSLTVGHSTGSISDDGKAKVHSKECFQVSAVRSLSSLVESSLNLAKSESQSIAKNAFLRVVRLWIFFCQHGHQDAEVYSFGELCQILSRAKGNIDQSFLESVVPSIFRDALYPASGFFAYAGEESNNPFADTLEKQCRMLYFLMEKLLLAAKSPSRPSAGVAAAEVDDFLVDLLPNILAQLTLEKDYDALRSTTAFNRYVMSRRRQELSRRVKPSLSSKVRASSDRVMAISTGAKGRLWARDLEKQTRLLCIESGVLERLLPLLLIHAGRDEDHFFKLKVMENKVSFADLFKERGQLILKNLIMELARTKELTPREMMALQRAVAFKGASSIEGSISTPVASDVDSPWKEALSSWISGNFMHLLVNLVQHRWQAKSASDKSRALRCLKIMLRFLQVRGSSQHIPQIMSTVKAALGYCSDVSFEQFEIHNLAVQILDVSVRRAWDDNWESVGNNLTSIVVALVPLLSQQSSARLNGSPEKSLQSEAESTAVSLVKWLSRDNRGRRMSSFFRQIPFLPPNPALDPVRSSLSTMGVEFDNLRLTMPEGSYLGSLSHHTSQSDAASLSSDSNTVTHLRQRMATLQDRLLTVCSLLGNENSSIRLVAMQHLTALVYSNRALFHALLDTEDTSSMARFLTTRKGKESGLGTISQLVATLLERCALETDEKVRRVIAKAFGEVGAISDNLLESLSRPTEGHQRTDPYAWRLSRPPWKLNPVDYQLPLLTEHLPVALKAATTSVDHHKIAFAVQETLKLVRLSPTSQDCLVDKANSVDPSSPSGMPAWLESKLDKAGVLQIIEPFSKSEFREKSRMEPKPPPYFPTASSYYEWVSSWCRYMVHRSSERRDSAWSKSFYACRHALRTASGLHIAEFLLPLIALDLLCFGDLQDEECVVKEILRALQFPPMQAGEVSMNHGERQKSVSTVFSLIDTLRFWSERFTEDRYRSSTSKHTEVASVRSTEWKGEDQVMRIDDVLGAVPLPLQADAASKAGMHARALRLLEMASRRAVVNQVFDASYRGKARSSRSVSSGYSSSDSVDLLKDTLAELGDYETIMALAEEDLAADALSRARDGIRRKESSKDWSGALQDYERAYPLFHDIEKKEKLLQGTFRCLLELGQYESVVRQVRGLSHYSSEAQTESLAPYAIEAAWRLGRWETLTELISERKPDKASIETENAQIAMGSVMLALHMKDEDLAMTAIGRARESVMGPLSAAAHESYSRSYPYIASLHCLREIEDAVPQICSDSGEKDLSTFVGEGGGFWDRRLYLTDPSFATTITQSRLALARLANSPGLEASLFLAAGKRARKHGQFGTAASAFAQAEAALDIVREDISMDGERSSLLLQLAKLKHETGETSTALRMLNLDDIESMAEMKPESIEIEISKRVSAMIRKDKNGMSKDGAADVFRKSALLSTKWMLEGGIKDGSEVIQRFRTIHRVAPAWEKGHFQFAKYIESALGDRISALHRRNQGEKTMDEDSFRRISLARDRTCQKYLVTAVKHFLEALGLDLKHLFQSLPRLLSLWFEFSSIADDDARSERLSYDLCSQPNSQLHTSQLKNKKKDVSAQLISQLRNKKIELDEMMARKYMHIPAHAFYSALPQLISRPTDQNNDLSMVIRGILVRVLAKFPGQAMWPLAWLVQSNDQKRREIGEGIFKDAQQKLSKARNSASLELLTASKELFKYLLLLAKHKCADDTKKTIHVKAFVGEIPLSKFIPPVQAALSPSFLPLESGRTQDPFPRQVPRMKEFDRRIIVMHSKARPKKLRASAILLQANPRTKEISSETVGEFHFLIKQEARGDLRKDARVQDLNNVINRLLTSSPRKRSSAQLHRRLRLRTFAVTCLSEETGILEWVPNTNSLRSLVSETYNPQAPAVSPKRRGRRMTFAADPMMRANYEKKCQEMYFVSGDLRKAATLYEDLILKAHPPIFYWWFVLKFQNPHAWYEARTQFTLSAAAWSAVGHVIGLGDRHSENILVDTTCGELVHVDFDCIFDKVRIGSSNLQTVTVVDNILTCSHFDRVFHSPSPRWSPSA